jgi:UDP-N-acetylglucosamine 2-epimerase (non-hydrolysing)
MSDSPLTIFSICGTRPEAIKLLAIWEKLRRDNRFKNIVVSTSQHREMIDDLFALFSIKPDHDLDIIQPNQSLTDISTRALSRLEPLLKQYRPDLVLVQGDTTTAFIGALAAFYQKILVGHVEAGLRSRNKMHPYPEEINRRLISLVCDLHFAPTERSAENLLKEGVGSESIFVTGNTVIDSLLDVAKRGRNTLSRYLPVETPDSQRMLLVTAHRRENWGRPLEKLCHALRDLTKNYPDIRVVYPVHLNPNVRKTVFRVLDNQPRVHLLHPLPYEPFVEAMVKAYLIITDSGGIQEEGPSLGKPILVFRKVTERPEGLATGGVKLVGLEKENVVRETSRLLDDMVAYQEMVTNYNPYGDGHAAGRIVKAILHHFGYGDRPEDFRAEPPSTLTQVPEQTEKGESLDLSTNLTN